MKQDANQDWIQSSLSSEQKLPLLRSERNASILASAGSGKTRTLVCLLLSDLNQGIPPKDIMAFTFTERRQGNF